MFGESGLAMLWEYRGGKTTVYRYILRTHAMHVFCPDEKSSGPVPSFWIYVACAACGSPCLLTFELSHCFRL